MNNQLGLEKLVDIARDELGDQSDTLRLLATKSSIVIAGSILILTQGIKDHTQVGECMHWLQYLQITALSLMALSAVISTIFGVLAINLKTYYKPSLNQACKQKHKNDKDILHWIIEAIRENHEYNKDLVNQSGMYFKYGVIALISAIVLLLISKLPYLLVL